MSGVSKWWLAPVVFGAFGLVGPLLRLLVPPMVLPEALDLFVYKLVLLLWPPQVFGLMETSVGTFRAGVVAYGTNLIVFILIGVIAAVVGRWSALLWAWQAVVLALVVTWALFWERFDVQELPWFAVGTALALYSVPFWIVRTGPSRAASVSAGLPNNELQRTRPAQATEPRR